MDAIILVFFKKAELVFLFYGLKKWFINRDTNMY